MSPDPIPAGGGGLPVSPSGLPRACGGLGKFDSNRVELIARGFDGDLTCAHRSRNSMLMLDRTPLHWEGPAGWGLAWSQPLPSARTPSSWRHAAQEAGACGLAFEDGRTFVHSDISGVGPVYFMRSGRAVYFATRIDPLVWASPEPLHPDWEAWAGILAMNLPIGDNTPFEEVRRLGPFSTLAARWHGAEVRSERWPWAEQEPRYSIETGIPGVVDAMRSTIDRLPSGPVALPLTGGWDSRVLLCLLRNDPDRPPRCVTTSRELGTWFEEDLAGAVARAAGVSHETVEPATELWWEDVRRLAMLADFQFVTRPWAVTLSRHLAGWDERPVLDGLALDAWSQPGTRYIPEDAINAATARDCGLALWRALQRFYARPKLIPYRPALRRALWESCEEQMVSSTERLGESPSRALLGFYLARTRKGVSLLPSSVLGAGLPMVTPFTTDEVTRACLAIDPKSKFGVGIHTALLHALDPELAKMPSSNDGIRPDRRGRPLRQRTPEAVRTLRAALEGGSLAPLLRRSAWESFDQGVPPNGALKVLMFHLWEERYREKLAAYDPADGFGVTPRDASPHSPTA